MPTKQFPKLDLISILWDEAEDSFTVLENKIIDNTRWSIVYNLIFKDLSDNKIYETSYSRGATESQDESPFEYDGDIISCTEVEPYNVVTTKYRPVVSDSSSQ